MAVIKCVFVLVMYILPLTYQQDLPSGPDLIEPEELTTINEHPAETTPIPSLVSPANPKPPHPQGSKLSPQNILRKLFQQFLRPVKVSAKTFGHGGPNVVAIIGDKPYISLEVFNKFSPLKWLFSAFQGKIQNVCQFLAPTLPDDPSVPPSTATVLDQLFEDNNLLQKPAANSGSRQQYQEYGPIRIYDVPAHLRNFKVKV